MKLTRKHARIIVPIASITFIAVGTYIAIQFAKGYRPTKEGNIQGTGLLAANSFPTAAEVYINGKLTSATNDTLSLRPGDYQVTIQKEGYIPWNKDLKVQAELVTQTNALLFRAVPGLVPLTLTGASNLTPSPDGQNIAFVVTDAANPAKNGLYVLNLSASNPLNSTKEPKLIARSPVGDDFSKSTLLWSPSSSQILLHLEPSPEVVSNYLLPIDTLTDLASITDTTARLPIILSQWEEEIASRETKQFALLPEALGKIATASAVNVYFSPTDKKLMYTSTGYIKLPDDLVQTPPSTSTQPEVRELESGGIYIYDLIEDKNFQIGGITLDDKTPQKHLLVPSYYQQSPDSDSKLESTQSATLPPQYNRLFVPNNFSQTAINFMTHYSPMTVGNYQWYPDSNHLLITQIDKVEAIESDATNRVTLYAGPFENTFTYPWPDGSRLIILTNLNPSSPSPANLYAVDLR